MATLTEWLAVNNQLSGWAQALATLITGPLAILAAWLAFRGARMQADAVLETQRLQQAMALARGLQAEAMDSFVRLTATKHRLEEADPREELADVVVPLDLGFYEANLGQIGLLQPDDVHVVMSVFKRAVKYQSELEGLLAKSPTVGQTARLTSLSKLMLSLVRDMHLAYVGLSISAGSTHEAALAQIKALEEDAEEYQRERRSLKG
ncbi:hypothetical protein CHU95_03570 [Niveispirillum lacus]|uniref:Uncharacterized protein n=1 Tax=Niveispirillum lacus TaxID=1981099 RepID=A0A255Z5Y7_9PROT|nr:hypothetical protein [Niveispirillum lacus]OYQ36859.1 hypothetical protein CHU95_03570 [Niveispirillum lacus]